MSENPTPPVPAEGNGLPARQGGTQVSEAWDFDDATDDGGGFGVQRFLAALGRFKWLVVASAIVGIGVGMLAYRMGEPSYRVRGSLWVNQGPRSAGGGPIRQEELLESRGWIELMRTGAVLDSVVLQQGLYVSSANTDAIEGFTLADRYYPGDYTLEINEAGNAWFLRTREGILLDEGVPGDSVGRERGFLWQPAPSVLEPGSEIDFTVLTLREATFTLGAQIGAGLDRDGTFINLSMGGQDPEKMAETLGAVMDRLVAVAGDLKGYQLEEEAQSLRTQLAKADSALSQASSSLEEFKIATATLPIEQSGPLAAGLESTTRPVYSDYFNRRLSLETARQDRIRLEEQLQAIEAGAPLRVEAFELIPAVRSSAQLTGALNELVGLRSQYRSMRTQFTDQYQPVQDLRDQITKLERTDIPLLTRDLVRQLRVQEEQMSDMLDSRAEELQRIPQRAIREATLQRDLRSAESLYNNVLQRLNTTELASQSLVPDLRILDRPVAPQRPANDPRQRWFLMAFLASLGLGAGAAILLDRFDPRLRYPKEVSKAMGLEILGAVPRVKQSKRGNAGLALEAFRELRMRLQYAYGNARPMVVAITSPESGAGKTFATANLGITYSQLGRKTLVIDADTRRGDMHELFESERKPGLTDLFQGSANGSVVRQTRHKNLDFLPCGSRLADSPDLLSSGGMQELLANAKRRYDVILIDCPPLAAGSDAFILGAHAGSVLVVLRSGSTHKELAKAKLEAFYRLPVRLLGAMLNDIDAGAAYGAYQYYSYYLPGYSAANEDAEDRDPVRA